MAQEQQSLTGPLCQRPSAILRRRQLQLIILRQGQVKQSCVRGWSLFTNPCFEALPFHLLSLPISQEHHRVADGQSLGDIPSFGCLGNSYHVYVYMTCCPPVCQPAVLFALIRSHFSLLKDEQSVSPPPLLCIACSYFTRHHLKSENIIFQGVWLPRRC